MSLAYQQNENLSKRLFVGQIPRSWNENDLRNLFQTFGDIVEANVIVDKYSGISKGCGFITYSSEFSAVVAQEKFHGKKILDGMAYPMYVKPADVGGINGKKIFVGMIGRITTKEDLRKIFIRFGAIEDITLLKSPEGIPKGCAFIKFYKRNHASQAVAEISGKFTMKGANGPIVVKIAESEQEKVLKKFQSAVWSITKIVENLGFNEKCTQSVKKEQESFDLKIMPKFTRENDEKKFYLNKNQEHFRSRLDLARKLFYSNNGDNESLKLSFENLDGIKNE